MAIFTCELAMAAPAARYYEDNHLGFRLATGATSAGAR